MRRVKRCAALQHCRLLAHGTPLFCEGRWPFIAGIERAAATPRSAAGGTAHPPRVLNLVSLGHPTRLSNVHLVVFSLSRSNCHLSNLGSTLVLYKCACKRHPVIPRALPSALPARLSCQQLSACTVGAWLPHHPPSPSTEASALPAALSLRLRLGRADHQNDLRRPLFGALLASRLHFTVCSGSSLEFKAQRALQLPAAASGPLGERGPMPAPQQILGSALSPSRGPSSGAPGQAGRAQQHWPGSAPAPGSLCG